MISLSDLYGTATPSSESAPPPVVNEASGESATAQPAFSWLGFLLLLIALRVIWEWKG